MNKLDNTYSIPLYENGIKTEWTIDGVVGDEKYQKLVSTEGNLPELVNVTTIQAK